MQPNSYPDGFPINPTEAINFSYFLSNEEKQEWLLWLTNSTTDQQHELVDTLHSMWLENQKEVVPQGFNLANTQSTEHPVSPALAPIPTIIQPPAPQTQINQNNSQVSPLPIQPIVRAAEISKPEIIEPAVVSSTQISEPVPLNTTSTMAQEIIEPAVIIENIPDKTKISQDIPLINPIGDSSNRVNNQGNQKPRNNTQTSAGQQTKPDFNENVKQFGQSKYTPNPVLENKTAATDDFVFQNSNSKSRNQRRTDNRNSNTDESEDLNRDAGNQNDTTQGKKAFFNFSKLREMASRKSLEEVYQQYLKSKDSNFNSEKEFRDNHALFLDKIMNIVVNFESVSDYFEAMTEKLLEVNDQNVALAEKLSKYDEESRSTVRDLTLRMDDLQRDLDRSYRSQKEIEGAVRQFSTSNTKDKVDVFGSEGNSQKLELIMSRLSRLEQGMPENSIRDRLNNLQKKDLPSGNTTKENQDSKKDDDMLANNNGRRKIDIKNLF